jgi:cytochrome c oxidase subunit I
VWAHHMFASGIGPISVAAFAVSTMFIAVPTGVKILNWMATMWGGKLTFTTPMLFAVGLVAMFTIGGLSGVTHAVAPADTQQTDTYYIVAHFHYVIFGGALFGFLGGFYFWWPKVFGWILDDARGKRQFWMTMIGFNLTFGPMHILGLQGMSRRIHTYREGYGFDVWNQVATVGAFLIALSIAMFFHNIWKSKKEAALLPPPGPDPWDARSLEWSIPSPTPAHNFDDDPIVTELDHWWHQKYGEDEQGRVVAIAKPEEVAMVGDPSRSHLPAPSYWPIVLPMAFPLIGYGLMFNMVLAGIGGAVLLAGLVGFALEPPDDEDLPPHGHDDHHGDDDSGEPAEVEPPADAEPAPPADEPEEVTVGD